MYSNLIDRISGWRLALLTAVSLGYGWLILAGLPFWKRLQIAEGGRELQERFFYSAAEARVALTAISRESRSDALTFYALDVPNAALFALSLGALIAFGLRLNGLSAGAWRNLVLLPGASGLFDIVENICLTLALIASQARLTVEPILGGITGIKLLTGNGSILAMLMLVGIGFLRVVWRKLRHRS